jgi:hypothetical protein
MPLRVRPVGELSPSSREARLVGTHLDHQTVREHDHLLSTERLEVFLEAPIWSVVSPSFTCVSWEAFTCKTQAVSSVTKSEAVYETFCRALN